MNTSRTVSVKHIFSIGESHRLAPRTVCLAVRMYDRASSIRKAKSLEEHLVIAIQAIRLAASTENDANVALSSCAHGAVSKNAPYFKKSLASTLGYRLGMKTPLDTIDEICYPAMEINNYSEPEMAAKKTMSYYLVLLDLGFPTRESTSRIAGMIDILATGLLEGRDVTENLYYRVLWTVSQLIPEISSYASKRLDRLSLNLLPPAPSTELSFPGAPSDWELETGEIRVIKASEMKSIGLFHTLGEGKNTLVRAAIPYSTSDIPNTKLALKTIEAPPMSSTKKKRLLDQQLQAQTFREISALSRLASRHVVNLHAFHHDITRKRYHLILTNGGKTLHQILEGADLGVPIRRSLARQLLTALEHIHSRHVIHGNLSLENILVDSEYCLRLIDFGSASILHSDHSFQLPPTDSPAYVSTRDDLKTAGVIIPQILLGIGKDLEGLLEEHALEYSIVYSMIHEEMSASKALALFFAL